MTSTFTFDEYLSLHNPYNEVRELVNGIVLTQEPWDLAQASLHSFLLCLLCFYSETHNLGQVLGSRYAVKISDYQGRLPDLLFVRHDRMRLMDSDGLRVAPDLVIETVSPGDTPSDIFALEADYQLIGATEIVFIDQQRRRVRVLRSHPTDEDPAAYTEEMLQVGHVLRLGTLGSVTLPVDWLLTEPRPTVRAALSSLGAA